jgi:hypothetical protein
MFDILGNTIEPATPSMKITTMSSRRVNPGLAVFITVRWAEGGTSN